MPVEAIHLSAFLDSAEKSGAARSFAAPEARDLGRLGSLIIDFPYFDNFPLGVARHFLKRPTAVSPWGDELHHGKPAVIAKSMLAEARRLRSSADGRLRADGERVLALALGFVSHLAVDASLHPLVNRLARARAKRLSDKPLRQHSEVEKFQSVLFHEARNGFDFMGRSELRKHISVDAHAIHRDPALSRAYRGGLLAGLGHAPDEAELGRWAKGYRQFVWLVSTPLGKTLVPERVKREVRDEVYSGSWGDFEQAYAQAVSASSAAIDAGLALVEDPGAEARFDAVVPQGAIDDLLPEEMH